jgi:sugar O-acyltransferase (sialic acid O-acetyltransferase NeuD family)
MLRPIVFWGATGQARVLREFIAGCGYELVALFDNNSAVRSPFDDVPLYHGMAGFARWLGERPPGDIFGLAAIGGSAGAARLEYQQLMERYEIKPATVVHPQAFVAGSAGLGPGSQVLAMAAVCADAVIGAACIVNTAASVDHECVLGDGVHVAPGARLAGCVTVGACSMIGMGALVLPRLRIGSHTIVGAGALVTRDLPDGVVAYGSPARVRRENA